MPDNNVKNDFNNILLSYNKLADYNPVKSKTNGNKLVIMEPNLEVSNTGMPTLVPRLPELYSLENNRGVPTPSFKRKGFFKNRNNSSKKFGVNKLPVRQQKFTPKPIQPIEIPENIKIPSLNLF